MSDKEIALELLKMSKASTFNTEEQNTKQLKETERMYNFFLDLVN